MLCSWHGLSLLCCLNSNKKVNYKKKYEGKKKDAGNTKYPLTASEAEQAQMIVSSCADLNRSGCSWPVLTHCQQGKTSAATDAAQHPADGYKNTLVFLRLERFFRNRKTFQDVLKETNRENRWTKEKRKKRWGGSSSEIMNDLKSVKIRRNGIGYTKLYLRSHRNRFYLIHC